MIEMETIFLKRENKEKIKEVCRHKYSEDNLTDDIKNKVREIIIKVKKEGDKALFEFTEKYDGARLNPSEMLVSKEEWGKVSQEVSDGLLEVIKEAIKKIKNYHLHQKENSWFTTEEKGIILGQVVNPIKRVGLYVPGGTAAYPSSLIMAAVPAMIAGVKEIVVVTPPSSDGKINSYLLSTARELGIAEIYKVGGAQAIAALAYGTETIPKADVIVGPGNIYVTLAKKLVSGDVGIDMLAGPSEILIVADDSAVPAYIAADLLSQAEHDPLSSSILVTTSAEIAKEVSMALEEQLKTLQRKNIAATALKKYGAILVVPDITTAIGIANRVAPEHLELQIRNPFSIIGNIRHAGAVFVGNHTPEPVGDYIAGPNHVLPTAGTARYASALSVDHFVKKTSLIHYAEAPFKKEAGDIMRLAEVEGLDAHVNSVRIRL